MGASPSETGRHRAIPGREGDLVETPALTERRQASARRDAIAIAFMTLVPIVLAVVLVVQNYAYWGRPNSTVVISSIIPDGTISQVHHNCDAARFTVRQAGGERTGSLRDCRTAYSVGQQLRVVWSPTDPAAVNAHVTAPLGVLADTGLAALLPIGLAGLMLVIRRAQSKVPSR
jgi:hypothetical protein